VKFTAFFQFKIQKREVAVTGKTLRMPFPFFFFNLFISKDCKNGMLEIYGNLSFLIFQWET
jgi:hypothetical protein